MNVTRADRHRLEAIVLDRSAPQKHVWRANIILATADGCGTECHGAVAHSQGFSAAKRSPEQSVPKFSKKTKIPLSFIRLYAV